MANSKQPTRAARLLIASAGALVVFSIVVALLLAFPRRDELVVAEPDVASPGQVVELHFDPEHLRGEQHTMSLRVGGAWEDRYLLNSDRGRDDGLGPRWSTIDDPLGVNLDAYGGPHPDRVVIPPTAAPGEYRICQRRPELVCAEIEVVAD